MIKIAVIDDHDLVLKAISNLLNANAPKFKVEVMCRSAIEFLQYLEKHSSKIDLALIDYSMPYINGADLSYLLSKRYPNIQKIGISSDDCDEFVDKFLLTGCRTFLSKDCSPEELFSAVEQVQKNNFYFNKYVSNKTIKIISNNNGKFCFPKELSEYQYFFILLCQTELTYKSIANLLMMKEDAVDKLRSNLFNKFSVKNRAELVAYAYEKEIVKVRKLRA